MKFTYTNERKYTQQQVLNLFNSVKWKEGKTPNRLRHSLQNLNTVYTAWHNDELIGLTGGMDDGAMSAYVQYLLVSPRYGHLGVGAKLLQLILAEYKSYPHVFIVVHTPQARHFYEKEGLTKKNNALVMYIDSDNGDLAE